MKYYLNILKFNILYEQPVTIILRGINLIFLLIFKKKKKYFSLNFQILESTLISSLWISTWVAEVFFYLEKI